jgi:hypothetical protein
MLYVIESFDLNVNIYNESIGFHILSNFGPHRGYLRRFSLEIRGGKYHNINMICDCTWADLEDVLAFQMIFVEAVIKNLKNLF